MKTGLIIEGGALRSAFSFGVLKTWADAGVTFPYTAAVSLGNVAAVYFRARQSEALEAAYGDYFDAQGEIGRLGMLKGERVINGPAFLDTVMNAHPVDMAAFLTAEGRLEMAATRSDNGDGMFWPLQEVSKEKHLHQFLRAGVTFPGMGEAIQLIERSYYDGSIAEPLPVSRALAAGCDRLVVIQTHLRTYSMKRPRLTFGIASALTDVPMTRNAYLLSHLHYNRELAKLHALEREGRALIVAPVVESSDLHRYGVSMSAASEFYAEGLRLGDAAIESLQRFLEGSAHE